MMTRPKTTRDYVELDIADIRSASENIRDAVPHLTKEGYGVFDGTDKHKDSLVALALSDDALQKKQYVTPMGDYEPEIVVLADNMATMGLLESDQGWRIRRQVENALTEWEAEWWNVYAPDEEYGDDTLGDESYATLREAKDVAEECFWRRHFEQEKVESEARLKADNEYAAKYEKKQKPKP